LKFRDTVSVTMTWLFYYLTMYPDIRAKLLEEITPYFGKTVPGQFADVDLGQIEYLRAIIDETLRIKPVAGNGTPRLTPPEGIVVDGRWIPGNIQVYVPPSSILRCEKFFIHADEFIPERWTTRPELVLDKRAFVPFNPGKTLQFGVMFGLFYNC
jgi:cytochrome P450